MKILSSLIVTILLISSAPFANAAAVNSHSCKTMAGTTQPFILVLNPGENLVDSVNQCAIDAKLKGASVTGLGQVQEPVLAYFSSDPKAKPTLTKFSGFYELASLTGNITNTGKHYHTHLHAVLANKKFQGLAGHVQAATAGLTIEMTITPFATPVQREVDPVTGFGPIVH